MRGFLLRFLLVAAGLWVASKLVPGVEISGGWALIFAALLAMSFWLDVPKWLAGAASVPAVLACMLYVPAGPKGWLILLGRASLAIYLMNTIAIGLTTDDAVKTYLLHKREALPQD